MALQTFPNVEPASEVIALDKAAHALVALQGRVVQTLPDGRIQVKLELANLSSQDLAIQVQTLFRDSGGMLIDNNAPFEMMVLPGNGSKLYETASLKAGATSYTIQVKTP